MSEIVRRGFGHFMLNIPYISFGKLVRFALSIRMTRKLAVTSEYFPFHITARTVNRDLFPIPLPILWQVYENYLYYIHLAYGTKLLSFVLMPNHFHLLAQFPKGNMSETMGFFMGETSRRVGEKSGRINQLYGGRYHRSLISNEIYFRHAYKYVYSNPVRANLVNRVEDYPFSSLHGLLGRRTLVIPIEEDTLLFNQEFSWKTVNWLNRNPQKTHLEEVRCALRKKSFSLPINKFTRIPSQLEHQDF